MHGASNISQNSQTRENQQSREQPTNTLAPKLYRGRSVSEGGKPIREEIRRKMSQHPCLAPKLPHAVYTPSYGNFLSRSTSPDPLRGIPKN